MVVKVFTESVTKNYYGNACVMLFSLCCSAALVLLPFFMAYNSHSFWLKLNTFAEQPQVTYSYNVLFIAEGKSADGSPLYLSATSYASSNSPAEFRSTTNDFNNDGITDSLSLDISIPLENQNDQIHKVSAFVYLDASLRTRANVDFDSIAVMSFDNPLSSQSVNVDGDLVLTLKSPLSVRGSSSTTTSLYADNTLSSKDSDIASKLSTLHSRNVSLNFKENYVLWKQKLVPSKIFEFHSTLRIPTKFDIPYKPELFEVLKAAWIQYYAFFVIVCVLLTTLQRFVYQNQLLSTYEVVVEKKKLY